MTTPLRVERKRRGLTTAQVAEATEIDPSYYCKIELGKAQPTPRAAEKIALYFGHAVSEMQILYPRRFPIPAEFNDDEAA